tara:strand:- start:588 stop:1883 length:1296 start_codon:yes stop_codon:yes gene_type:complete
MHYKLIILVFGINLLFSQSLFNRWIGTNPYIGSPRSTSMGHTHLLNSTGSSIVRFNPSKLGLIKPMKGFDFQLNRNSTFQRWSIPVRDSFGEFLTDADYVANKFSYYGTHFGLITSTNLTEIGSIGIGFHYTPLTHFTYEYSEEIRGSYKTQDGEYASKDPIIGYHNLSTNSTPMVSTLGGGVKFVLDNINVSFGGSFSIIQSSLITDQINIDTLFSDDMTNLSKFSDFYIQYKVPTTNFINLSSTMNLSESLQIGISWEQNSKSQTTLHNSYIDSSNGLFQYFNDSSYSVIGLNYMKPEIKSIGISYISNIENPISINLEINQISYFNHLNLNDYKQFKFGFEYISSTGTPIRAGLLYKTSPIQSIKPISILTFGSGKSFKKITIDFSTTYCFQSYYYNDLFPIPGETRPELDLVKESKLNIQLGITYIF